MSNGTEKFEIVLCRNNEVWLEITIQEEAEGLFQLQFQDGNGNIVVLDDLLRILEVQQEITRIMTAYLNAA